MLQLVRRRPRWLAATAVALAPNQNGDGRGMADPQIEPAALIGHMAEYGCHALGPIRHYVATFPQGNVITCGPGRTVPEVRDGGRDINGH